VGTTRDSLICAQHILWLNRVMIKTSGGLFLEPHNLHNPGSLDFVLESLDASSFGKLLYPTAVEKAAALGWTVIASHVFHDRNKRTGMLSIMLFLRLSGLDLARSDAEIEAAALEVADTSNKRLSREDFTAWVRSGLTTFERPRGWPRLWLFNF
jgi:death-on-curing protein